MSSPLCFPLVSSSTRSNASAFLRVSSNEPGPNAGIGRVYGFANTASRPVGIRACRAVCGGTGWNVNCWGDSGQQGWQEAKSAAHGVVDFLVVFVEYTNALKLFCHFPTFFLIF